MTKVETATSTPTVTVAVTVQVMVKVTVMLTVTVSEVQDVREKKSRKHCWRVLKASQDEFQQHQ